MTLQQQHEDSSADRDPAPAAEWGEDEDEEEWMGALAGGLGLADDDATPADEQQQQQQQQQQLQQKPVVDKKRQRQLRSKVGWYRRISQHVSKGAKKRIRALWPQFGIEAPPWSVALDIPALFAPAAQVEHVIVEVGFGGGDCLVPLAKELLATRPDVGLVGCEWHMASMGGALARLDAAGVHRNVRVFRGDVLHHLRAGWFGPGSVDEVLVVCPDPWPKEADWPRRVVNPESVDLLAACVKPGGYLHVATDVLDYARWVGRALEEAGEAWEACSRPDEGGSVLAGTRAKPLRYRGKEEEEEEDQAADDEGGQLPSYYCHALELVAEVYGLLPVRPRWRPVTRYEYRGLTDLGHSIYDLCYRRKA